MKPGLYRHYKGRDYFLFQVVTHSETSEPLACYRCLYGSYSWWARPLSMFVETVDVAGRTIPRFQFVRELTLPEQMQYLITFDDPISAHDECGAL